jgi:hypothetical protein
MSECSIAAVIHYFTGANGAIQANIPPWHVVYDRL